MNRREALKLVLCGGAAVTLGNAWPTPALAGLPRKSCSGLLSCHNLHTDERLTTRYLDRRGRFDTGALEDLDHLFRCHYNDRVHPIDPGLFVLLDTVRCRIGVDRPYELISGYRSPEYNAVLRSRSAGVAKQSYHLKGMAADVRLGGVSVASLYETAREFRSGGVGRYRDFVHVDVGPVRYW